MGSATAASGTGTAATTSASGSQTTSTSGSAAGATSGVGSASGTSTASRSGNATSTSSTGVASSSSSSSSFPQAAIIAIAVLAAVVGLLVIFILWRFCRERSIEPQQQTQFYQQQYPVPWANPPTSTLQRADAPYVYPLISQSPRPETTELSGDAATQAGQVHETDASVHRIELAASNRK
jgi:hypothetical protein